MISEFLEQNPEFKVILERALEHEEQNSKREYYHGWEWHDVKAHPAKLMKLVIEGITQIGFKSRRFTFYLLNDREEVKRALKNLIIKIIN